VLDTPESVLDTLYSVRHTIFGVRHTVHTILYTSHVSLQGREDHREHLAKRVCVGPHMALGTPATVFQAKKRRTCTTKQGNQIAYARFEETTGVPEPSPRAISRASAARDFFSTRS